jgi:steroid 5-alpha reductase family enzyme
VLFLKTLAGMTPFGQLFPVVLTIMCWADISSAGNVQRAFLMHACLLFWAIRLTYNWMRSWEGFSHEDWRYIMMKGKTNNKFPVLHSRFWFYTSYSNTLCLYGITSNDLCSYLFG